MMCDRCGEDWEHAFFCKECEEVEVYTPGEDPNDDVEDGDGVTHVRVVNCCGNCCTCHLRAPVANEELTLRNVAKRNGGSV